MNKIIIVIISSLLISAAITSIVINLVNEKKEFHLATNFLPKLINWHKEDITACVQENINNTTGTEITPINYTQILKLKEKAVTSCAMDITVGVPANIALILFEERYIPVESAIPYELAKQALGDDSKSRCSDYVKPLLLACPSILQPYVEPKG